MWFYPIVGHISIFRGVQYPPPPKVAQPGHWSLGKNIWLPLAWSQAPGGWSLGVKPQSTETYYYILAADPRQAGRLLQPKDQKIIAHTEFLIAQLHLWNFFREVPKVTSSAYYISPLCIQIRQIQPVIGHPCVSNAVSMCVQCHTLGMSYIYHFINNYSGYVDRWTFIRHGLLFQGNMSLALL